MTDSQKLFASLSGAVVAHVFMLAFVVLAIRNSAASLASQGVPELRQQEVTIMLSDLMDQVKVEPPEPKPVTLTPKVRRSFFDTSTNQREIDSPENARFYSDRNTSAATEILPDPNAPQQYGPTTDGDAPISHLRLQDLDYVDGRLDAPPAKQVNPGETGLADGGGIQQTSARNGIEDGTGTGAQAFEGKDTPPENAIAEERTRPEQSPLPGEDEKSMRRRSFTDPNSVIAGSPQLRDDDADQFAATDSEEEAEVGRPADMDEEKERMSGVAGGESTAETGDAKKNSEGVGKRPGDVGLFADGFQTFTRKNATNGTLSNLGENGVDAEESAAGRYEASVRQAIAKKWHSLRAKNGDFVTYSFLKLRCRVDRNGKVHDLEVVEKKANSVVTSFSLEAIMKADLPKMPDDVAVEYGPTGLELNYDIFIY